MFKKPAKNFRSRRKQLSSDEDESDSNVGTIADEKLPSSKVNSVSLPKDDSSQANSKAAKSKGVPKSSSVVSFELEEDEEGEVFKIKKSSHSKKYTKKLKKKLQEEKEQQSGSPLPTQTSTASAQAQETNAANGSSSPHSIGSDFEFEDEEDNEQGSGFKSVLQSGLIPDAATIHKIRKQRQQARDGGDFIPLEDTQKVENTKSRLIRDDENDASDDEGRIDFTVGGRDAELRQMQETILAAREESDESEHDWEEQQIRKGVGIAMQGEGDASQDSTSASGRGFSSVPMGFSIGDNLGKEQISIKRTISVADLPKISVDLIHKRLQERLEEGISVHRGHCQERDTLSHQLETSQDQAVNCNEQTEQLALRYRFFQEIRSYIQDLIECLNEKVPKINYLEKSFLKLWQKRTDKVIQRRQQDIKDESQDCMTAIANKAVTVDQNSMDQQKMRRVAEREARRNRRKRKREHKKDTGTHHDGMSTDDEANPSELSLYQSEKERLLVEAERLFEDVEDDYFDLKQIQQHFVAWREQQPQSYYEAYVALCLPKLFTPFVKLKLINWNVVEENLSLEKSAWFNALLFYGSQNSSDENHPNDDLKLLPSIIEKVLLPKVTDAVQQVWDPMSSQQTKQLINVITDLTAYPTVSSDSKNVKALVKAVTDRIRKCLDEDVFMPLYPKQMLENRGPAWVFFHRQLWSCIKLFSNITAWHGVLSAAAVKVLSLDSLLNRYILLGLQNCTIEDVIKCVKLIVAEMPKEWFSSDKSEDSIPQLSIFCRFLTQTCLNLDKIATASGKEYELKLVKDKAKQVVKILVSIHAMDSALTLANHFSIKIGVI